MLELDLIGGDKVAPPAADWSWSLLNLQIAPEAPEMDWTHIHPSSRAELKLLGAQTEHQLTYYNPITITITVKFSYISLSTASTRNSENLPHHKGQ